MLKTIAIADFTVTEAGPLEASRLVTFSAQYQRLLDAAQAAGDNADPEAVDRLAALSMWPPVAACVAPRLDMVGWESTPLDTIVQLTEAARELNPTWFGQLDDAQKKSKPPKKRK